MTEDTSRRLKILVERVVRPLPLPLPRQKRLRTEFLSHLQEIYAEELARDGDAEAAFTRTGERFGNPEELTAELRGTIRGRDLWEHRLQAWFEQRGEESTSRFIIRMLTIMVSIPMVWIGLMMADHHVFGSERASWLQIRLAGSAVAFLAVWMGAVLTFGMQMGAEWERPTKRWIRILILGAGMIAAWPLSLAVLMSLAGGTWSDYAAPLAGSILGGIMNVVMGTVFGVFHRRDTSYRREWAQLDLSAG